MMGNEKFKVLVTGGSGMVGKNLRKIEPGYIYMSSKDCDLRNYNDTLQFFRRHKPTHVIHLAAKVGGLYMNMISGYKMLMDNLQINMNVISVCKELSIKNFIGCLSTCVFPEKVEKYPMVEEDLHKGPPHFSNRGYAYAKRMLEVMCEEMNKFVGNSYICIIPTNIYGKYDNFNIDDAHIIPALIHKFYQAKKENNTVKVKGSGNALRQFIWAGDLAYIISYLVTYRGNKRNFICSPPDEISVKDVVDILIKLFDWDNVEWDRRHSDGQIVKSVKSETEEWGQIKWKNFKEGLKETVDWFIENYNTVRK